MTSTEIRRWRPTRYRDFIGARNRRVIERLRRNLISRGRLPSPLLLTAPFGYGKTSLARLLMLGLNCSDPDPETGDPCRACEQCVGFVPANNRTGFPFLRLEVDCTHARRPQIIRLCREFRLDANAAIFLDELHRLHENHSQEPLLKFLEDFPGILIAAVMADRYQELIPPLRERFETVCLEPPAAEEVVAFLAEKCSGEWRIRAEDHVLRAMVRASGVSFRLCLKVLAAAAEREPRLLDGLLLDELLGGHRGLDDGGTAGEGSTSGEIDEGEFFPE
jgi:replication-associated recombination protein RarA